MTDIDADIQYALELSMSINETEVSPKTLSVISDSTKTEFDTKKEIFIQSFPNVINSCYIDTIILSMFLFPGPLKKYLKNYNKDAGVLMLQDHIQLLMTSIRNGDPVTEDRMTGFRNLIIEIGWKDFDDMYDQQDTKEFYSFILEKLCIPAFKFRRVTYTGAQDISDHGDEEKCWFVPLNISSENSDGDNISDLFERWMNDNPSKIRRSIIEGTTKKEIDVDCLNTYYLDNQPPIIGLWVNRFPDTKTRYDTKLQIKKTIYPFKNQQLPIAQRMLVWGIQAIICHRQNFIQNDPPPDYSPLNSGHYYALIIDPNNNNTTYIFDDLETPALKKVSMNDTSVTDLIKRECVFVLYTQQFELE